MPHAIAYANDFLFMFFICVPVLAVIMLMRAPPAWRRQSAAEFIE